MSASVVRCTEELDGTAQGPEGEAFAVTRLREGPPTRSREENLPVRPTAVRGGRGYRIFWRRTR